MITSALAKLLPVWLQFCSVHAGSVHGTEPAIDVVTGLVFNLWDSTLGF